MPAPPWPAAGVRFPGLVAARPAGGPSLEQALNQLAAQKPGASGVPAPAGVFTGRDGLFYELETAARLQKVVILASLAGTGKTQLAKASGRWRQDTGGVERPEWASRSSSPRPSAPQPVKSVRSTDKTSDARESGPAG